MCMPNNGVPSLNLMKAAMHTNAVGITALCLKDLVNELKGHILAIG